MAPSSKVLSVLDDLQEERAEFFATLEALYLRRFCGTISLDFQNGLPKVVNFPSVRVVLTNIADQGLDKT